MIFGMRAPKRKAKKPKFFVDVFYSADKTKTAGLELSMKTYGPAQCKVESVRIGETLYEGSYTAGWVFLVPQGDEGRLNPTDEPSDVAAPTEQVDELSDVAAS